MFKLEDIDNLELEFDAKNLYMIIKIGDVVKVQNFKKNKEEYFNDSNFLPFFKKELIYILKMSYIKNSKIPFTQIIYRIFYKFKYNYKKIS